MNLKTKHMIIIDAVAILALSQCLHRIPNFNGSLER